MKHRAPVMGRPPLKAKERKGSTFSVRFTEAERKEIDGAAKTDGIAASEWARRVLLDAAKRR